MNDIDDPRVSTLAPALRAQGKFTPGPWVTDEHNRGKVYCSDATGSIVAQCDQFDFAPRPRSEQEANARLIAAAPELFEALKASSFAIETLLCDTVASSCTLVNGVYDESTAAPAYGAYIARLKALLEQVEDALRKATNQPLGLSAAEAPVSADRVNIDVTACSTAASPIAFSDEGGK